MKKLFISTCIATVVAVASFSSYAQSNNSGLYVNGSVGSTQSEVRDLTKKNDTGYGFNVGYRWNGMWGVEAGYVDLGQAKADGYRVGRNVYDLTLKTSGWTLGVNGKFDFATHWYVSARGGLFFSDTQLLVSGSSDKATANDTNAYVGIGAGYNFNKNMSAGVSFDRYLAKAHGILDGTNNPYMLSATFEYRF